MNTHLEITMGCLRHEKNVEVTFLFGNTTSQEYTVHHWAGAWEPYNAANAQIKEYLPDMPISLEVQEIVEEQKRIKNDVLLPWMRNSPTINILFPELFVTPAFVSEKKRRNYTSIRDFINSNEHSNIIVTGDAGYGKTTLLRQIFLFENTSLKFRYLHARALTSPIGELRAYQISIRSLLLNGAEDDSGHVILLDGIDEAYSNNDKELEGLINSIDRLKNTSVWFGWRRDHLNRNETEVLRQITDDIVSLEPWTPKMSDKYVVAYADAFKRDDIIDNYRALVSNNITIEEFAESPFQLSLLVYLLHNKKSDPVIEAFFRNSKLTIFSLYDTFFRCWVKREHTRKTSHLNEEKIRESLWNISNKLYYNQSCKIKSDDTAITNLLSFSLLGDGQTATGFFHRSFCAFFIADKAFCAVKAGDLSIIEALSTPMRNDVTDFLRSAISGCEKKEIEKIQANLIAVYKQTDDASESILSSKAQSVLREMDESSQFVLKNELIYLITRIPDPTNCVPNFFGRR